MRTLKYKPTLYICSYMHGWAALSLSIIYIFRRNNSSNNPIPRLASDGNNYMLLRMALHYIWGGWRVSLFPSRSVTLPPPTPPPTLAGPDPQRTALNRVLDLWATFTRKAWGRSAACPTILNLSCRARSCGSSVSMWRLIWIVALSSQW